jgi:membrane-associated phospholipid phosphatase
MIEDQVKPLVGRPRPDGPAPGFPSGHVTAAATYAVILIRAGIQERSFPAAARGGLVLLAVAYVGGVGLARLLLRAHWPSDVLGGLALGTACVAAGAWWVAAREARGSGQPVEAERAPAGTVPAAPDSAGSGRS